MRELHERNQIGVKAADPRNSSLFRGFVVPSNEFRLSETHTHFNSNPVIIFTNTVRHRQCGFNLPASYANSLAARKSVGSDKKCSGGLVMERYVARRS